MGAHAHKGLDVVAYMDHHELLHVLQSFGVLMGPTLGPF